MSGKEACDKCICKGCVCRKCNCKRKSGNSTEINRDTVCGDTKCNEDVGKLVVNRNNSDESGSLLSNFKRVRFLDVCHLLLTWKITKFCERLSVKSLGWGLRNISRASAE